MLLTTILSILAVSIGGYLSITLIRGATEDTLSKQLELNLKSVVSEQVSSIDAKLQHYEKYMELLVDSVEHLYADQEASIAAGSMIYPPTDTEEYEFTRAFASDKLSADESSNEILLLSNMRSIMEPIARENEGLITSIYLGTKDGLLVSYDRFSHLTYPPAGGEFVYNFLVSEWYTRGMKEDGIFYTGVYMNPQGRGLTITIASPFKDKLGKVAGVACIDFDLTVFYDELFATNLENGTFIFALDHTDTIISADSDMIDLREYTGLSLDDLDELKADSDGVMEMHDNVYVCFPIDRVQWTLCAFVPMTAVQETMNSADESMRNITIAFAIVVLLIILIALIAVNRSVSRITYPLELLERDIKIIAGGDFAYRATVYRNDEIGDIASGMNEMVDRLNFTLNELMSSQQHADAMSRLATLDTLTGIRNKTSFDRHSEALAEEIAAGQAEFGFAMIDLNNLKVINDNYGHEKGDIAIKGVCQIITDVFARSPIFRIGGDEFVVLLKDDDYRDIESLVKQFKEMIRIVSSTRNAKPWERISAAIGYALYDADIDDGTESVLSRADKAMYANKKAMKGF